MITTSETDIVMSKSRFYDIIWAIEQLDIPEDNLPKSILIRSFLGGLYADVKLLKKCDARVARTETLANKKKIKIITEAI